MSLPADSEVVALLFRRVGDSLMATPALRALKLAEPSARIAVIVEPQVERVFEHNPWVDEIRTVEPGPSVLTLAAVMRRNGRPQVALDFLSDPRSAYACALSFAVRRVGFVRRGRSWAYTDRVARQSAAAPVYSAQHKLELVRALGVATDDTRTEFYLSADDAFFASAAWSERGWKTSSPVAAFFVHSRRDHKRWPLSHFRELIARVLDEGLAIPLILATPGDESAVAELLARTALPMRNSVAVSNLGQLGAVLRRCRVLVGNDGGPKHLAVALEVPTVTIFSPGAARHWTPPDSPLHVALEPPPDDPTAKTVGDLPPERVFDALAAMLASTTP